VAAESLTRREQSFYNQRWDHTQLSSAEIERATITLAAIPRDCKRILDVGCGDGRVSQKLSNELGLYVVGCDLSSVALARLSLPRCCGSAAELPFADKSFDLTIATEILEHMPASQYERSLTELARVAGKYILITVPNGENLDENTAVCGACGAHFHIWGHVRTYTPELMQRLFSDFDLSYISPFGSLEEKYHALLLWIRHRVAGAWAAEPETICHECHATQLRPPRFPFLAKVCDFLNARFWAPHAKRAGWLLALYVRQKK
jgi:SAM-dependent methyltransferase